MPKKWTNENVDKLLDGEKVYRVSDYVNIDTSMRWGCHDCGYEWETSFGNIKRGSRCAKCAGNIRLTNEEVDRRIANRSIQRISEYVNRESVMQWKCLDCNSFFPAKFGNIHSGKGCPSCAGNKKKCNEEVDRIIAHRPLCRLGDYDGKDNPVSWRCNMCNHVWEATFRNINQGKGCPKCCVYRPTPTSLYIGIVQKGDSYYLKPGITSYESMRKRYQSGSEDERKSIRSVDQLRFYTQKESCIDLERDLIAFCTSILGEPVAGHEWFRLPDEDELDEILIYFKKITQRK
jgi:hypothetical protein